MDEIIRKFLPFVSPLKPYIKEMYLFGSRYRDNWMPDSDYDIMIVLETKNRVIIDKLYDIVMDILLETGKLISLKIFTAAEHEMLKMEIEELNREIESMSCFLKQVGEARPAEFSFMVLDGVSSHKSKDIKVPDNVSLILLPPYSPELNPAEHIWNRLRKNYFANKVFDLLEAATCHAEYGKSEMAANPDDMAKLTNWP